MIEETVRQKGGMFRGFCKKKGQTENFCRKKKASNEAANFVSESRQENEFSFFSTWGKIILRAICLLTQERQIT